MTQTERLWNTNYVKVWCANFMIFFSFMVVTPLLPLYLSETYQADKDTIGFVLSGYTLTALLARPVAGYLVDSFCGAADMLFLVLCFVCRVSDCRYDDAFCHHQNSTWSTDGSGHCGK